MGEGSQTSTWFFLGWEENIEILLSILCSFLNSYYMSFICITVENTYYLYKNICIMQIINNMPKKYLIIS